MDGKNHRLMSWGHYVAPPPAPADARRKLKEQLETPAVGQDGQPQITEWTD